MSPLLLSCSQSQKSQFNSSVELQAYLEEEKYYVVKGEEDVVEQKSNSFPGAVIRTLSTKTLIAQITHKKKSLLEALESSKASVRANAAAMLCEIDPLNQDIYQLCQALTQCRNYKAVEGGYEYFYDLVRADVHIRIYAAEELGKRKDKKNIALHALTGALHDPDPRVRVVTLESLAKIGNHQTLCLIEYALSDPAKNVRFAALSAHSHLSTRLRRPPSDRFHKQIKRAKRKRRSA